MCDYWLLWKRGASVRADLGFLHLLHAQQPVWHWRRGKQKQKKHDMDFKLSLCHFLSTALTVSVFGLRWIQFSHTEDVPLDAYTLWDVRALWVNCLRAARLKIAPSTEVWLNGLGKRSVCLHLSWWEHHVSARLCYGLSCAPVCFTVPMQPAAIHLCFQVCICTVQFVIQTACLTLLSPWINSPFQPL